jgi:hypothetical protein
MVDHTRINQKLRDCAQRLKTGLGWEKILVQQLANVQ